MFIIVEIMIMGGKVDHTGRGGVQIFTRVCKGKKCIYIYIFNPILKNIWSKNLGPVWLSSGSIDSNLFTS